MIFLTAGAAASPPYMGVPLTATSTTSRGWSAGAMPTKEAV